jgi:hypothetical protein
MACRLASSVTLQALIAAVKRSPIVVRLGGLRITPSEWGRIRNSPDVEAFVLAWIASHAPASRRAPHTLM